MMNLMKNVTINGINYRLLGTAYVPTAPGLILDDRINDYGFAHMKYLQMTHPNDFSKLQNSGLLQDYLARIGCVVKLYIEDRAKNVPIPELSGPDFEEKYLRHNCVIHNAKLIVFMERLVIDVNQKVYLLLDNLKPHHSKKTTACVESHADQIKLFHLPPYSSEYNPDEYGDALKSFAVYLYGQGVQSLQRTTELIAGLTNNVIRLSEGTISNWLDRFHNAAASAKEAIENRLLDYHQVNTDGTVVALDGRQSYIRNFSTKNWVLYVSMGSKGHKALSEIPFLKRFAGILMHDHETSLYRYGVGHVECNVHLLRYLRKNTEDTEHCWSGKLAALLTEMNNYIKRLKTNGETQVPSDTLKRLEDRYDEILGLAVKERKTHLCRYNWANREEKALLNRLTKYKKQHLLFLHDFAVSFDNNMSERDLRKCKNRQKMSGGFRTEHGKEIFCSVLSVIETCKRQALNLFDSLKKVFNGQALFS